jgi:lysophospholipase L1-like esterase
MKGTDIKSDSNWIMIAVVSTICALFLITGIVLAFTNSANGANMPTPKQATEKTSAPKKIGSISLFAMGDSLTKGYMDDKNLGYIGNLEQGLEKRGQNVTVDNVASNGLVSTQLVHELQDPQVLNKISHATIIAFSIGGNDLLHTVHNYTLPTLEQTSSAEQTYLKNLDTILQIIRAHNKNAPIRMVGLYNPFLQFAGGAAGTAIVEDWNAHTSTLLRKYSDALLVPTLDLFTANGESFLADDHFHPNSDGYQAIAERMLQDITIGNR